MGGTEEEPSPCARRCTVIMVIVGAVAGLVMLILAIIAYAQIAGFVNDYNQVINTWQEQPVSSLTLGLNGTCPTGYSTISSFFPAINDACDCDNPNVNHGNSTTNPNALCTQQQITDNCFNRHSQFPRKTPVNPFPGRPICIYRNGPSALDRTPNPDACAVGERVCGTGAGRICWPGANPACPITDFAISNVLYSLNESLADDPVESFATHLGTYYLYVKRGGALNNTVFGNRPVIGSSLPETGLPLTDIHWQASDPCTLSGCGYGGRGSEHSTMVTTFKANNNNTGYQPQSYDCDGGCLSPDISDSVSPSGRDIRYTRVLARQERDLFTESPAAAGQGAIPTQFITTGNYPWYLQYRSEVVWKLDCPESRETVVSRETDVDSVRRAQLALLILGIISFIFLSIIFPCMEICWTEKAKQYKNQNCFCKITVKGAILGATLATVIIAYSTLAFWDSINGRGKAGDACSDPLTSETFRVLGDKFYSLSYKNAISTASSGVTSFGDAIWFVCKSKF